MGGFAFFKPMDEGFLRKLKHPSSHRVFLPALSMGLLLFCCDRPCLSELSTFPRNECSVKQKTVDARFGIWRAGCRSIAFDLRLCLPKFSSNNTSHHPNALVHLPAGWYAHAFCSYSASVAVHKLRSHHFSENLAGYPQSFCFGVRLRSLCCCGGPCRATRLSHLQSLAIKRRLLCAQGWRHSSTPRAGSWLRT